MKSGWKLVLMAGLCLGGLGFAKSRTLAGIPGNSKRLDAVQVMEVKGQPTKSKHLQSRNRRRQMHTYEVKFRLQGRISYVEVPARDAGHAKSIVLAQFGDAVTVLQVRRVD